MFDDRRTVDHLQNVLAETANPWERISLLVSLCIDYGHAEWLHVQEYSREVYMLARQLKDPYWLAQAHFVLGLSYGDSPGSEERLAHLAEAERGFERLGEILLMAQVRFYIATTRSAMGEHTESLGLTMHCLEVFRRCEEYKWVARSYISLGYVNTVVGLYGKALRYLKKGERIARRCDARRELGLIYNLYGRLYGLLDDPEREERYLRLGLKMCSECGNTWGMLVAYTALSTLYGNCKDRKRLIYCTVNALRLMKKFGSPAYERAMELQKLAHVYRWDGDHERALHLLKKCMKVLKNSGETAYAACGYFILARQYQQMESFDKAVCYAEKASRLGRNLDDLLIRRDICELLAEVYEQVGQSEKALECFKQAVSLEKQLAGPDKQRELLREEARLALEDAKERIREQQKELSTLSSEKKQKEEELVSMALDLTHHSERLSRMDSGRGNGMAPHNNAHAWDTFSRYFHKVHRDFYYVLARRYPSLTVTEMKVCSLIRIGLSSKEIADFLCVSKRTVDSHREHIRTKLNLPVRMQLARTIQAL